MAQASTWNFTLKETVTALLREQGITEGHWELQIDYQHGGGMLGINGAEQWLSLIFQIKSIGILRVAQPTATSVDASTIQATARWPEEVGQ